MAYKDPEHGWFTPAQSDLNWAQTFRMTLRAPAIANRIFDTLEHAQAYIDDYSDKASAVPGIILCVTSDSNIDNNGMWLVLSVRNSSSAAAGTMRRVDERTVFDVTNLTTDLAKYTTPGIYFFTNTTTGKGYVMFVEKNSNNETIQTLMNSSGYQYRTGSNATPPIWGNYISRTYLTDEDVDTVRNIYVHELTLSQMYIKNAIITGVGNKDLTYVSGSDVTISSVTYGKFVDSASTEYYIALTGALLHKTILNIYTYDSSVPSVTSVGSYTKDNVLPIVATPTFTGNEDASNTLFHLNNGATDTYYYWDAEYSQYVAVTTHIQANKFYIWTTALTTGQVLMVTFDSVEDASLYNEYMIQFRTGETIPTLSFPAGVKWNLAPDLDINVTYQVSVVNNIGLIAGGLE